MEKPPRSGPELLTYLYAMSPLEERTLGEARARFYRSPEAVDPEERRARLGRAAAVLLEEGEGH